MLVSLMDAPNRSIRLSLVTPHHTIVASQSTCTIPLRQSAVAMAYGKHVKAQICVVCASNRPPHAALCAVHAVTRQQLQVRVMPRCWLVLLRFWLRVDQVLVRLRETRYFCDTAAAPATVLREVKHSEGTFAELRAGGAPPEGVRVRVSHAVPTDGCPRT